MKTALIAYSVLITIACAFFASKAQYERRRANQWMATCIHNVNSLSRQIIECREQKR